jgi:hypothetical protein
MDLVGHATHMHVGLTYYASYDLQDTVGYYYKLLILSHYLLCSSSYHGFIFIISLR